MVESRAKNDIAREKPVNAQKNGGIHAKTAVEEGILRIFFVGREAQILQLRENLGIGVFNQEPFDRELQQLAVSAKNGCMARDFLHQVVADRQEPALVNVEVHLNSLHQSAARNSDGCASAAARKPQEYAENAPNRDVDNFSGSFRLAHDG